MLAGQAVQHKGIHIIADPKGEEARVVRHGFCDRAQQQVGLHNTLRGQAVGKEENRRRALSVAQVGRFQQRLADIRAAGRLQAVNEANIVARLRGGNQLVRIIARAGAEGDDVKAVGWIEVLDHVAGCRLRLRHLLAVHAAGGVHNQYDILGDDGRGVYFNRRRYQQQEEAILPGLLVAQQVQPDLVRRHAVVQLEIAVGVDRPFFIAYDGAELRRPVHRDLVTGRVDGANGLVGRDLNPDALVFQRLVGVEIGGLRIDVANQAAFAGQYLTVLDGNPAFLVRRNREDVGLDRVHADVLQQGGIAQLADDFVVDSPRLAGAEDLGLNRRPINPHGQLADRCPGRQWEQVCAFHDPIIIVNEELLHARDGYLAGNGHIHALRFHPQPIRRRP